LFVLIRSSSILFIHKKYLSLLLMFVFNKNEKDILLFTIDHCSFLLILFIFNTAGFFLMEQLKYFFLHNPVPLNWAGNQCHSCLIKRVCSTVAKNNENLSILENSSVSGLWIFCPLFFPTYQFVRLTFNASRVLISCGATTLRMMT